MSFIAGSHELDTVGFDFSQLLEEAREMDKLSQDKKINEIKTSMKDTRRRKSLWVPTAVSKLQCPGHLSLVSLFKTTYIILHSFNRQGNQLQVLTLNTLYSILIVAVL